MQCHVLCWDLWARFHGGFNLVETDQHFQSLQGILTLLFVAYLSMPRHLPPARRPILPHTHSHVQIQQFHGIWGLITLFNLLFFSESFGQLSWAAESILTDSMSLMAGFYLMQSDVDKQVKYIALRLLCFALCRLKKHALPAINKP